MAYGSPSNMILRPGRKSVLEYVAMKALYEK